MWWCRDKLKINCKASAPQTSQMRYFQWQQPFSFIRLYRHLCFKLNLLAAVLLHGLLGNGDGISCLINSCSGVANHKEWTRCPMYTEHLGPRCSDCSGKLGKDKKGRDLMAVIVLCHWNWSIDPARSSVPIHVKRMCRTWKRRHLLSTNPESYYKKIIKYI